MSDGSYTVSGTRLHVVVQVALLLVAALAVAMLLTGHTDISDACGSSPDCSLLQTLVYAGLAVAILICLPLGFSNIVGVVRREGLEISADPSGLRFAATGYWEGPLAWHSISAIRALGRGPTARIGIDLVTPDRATEDLGRPLGPVERWRIRHGGPALTISGHRLADPVEDVTTRLNQLREAFR